MISVMAILLSGVIGSASSNLEWTDDYGVALSSARCEGRPMLVVLENREKAAQRAGSIFHVEEKVLTKFEICRVDVGSDYGKKIAELYSPSELPYTVITDSDCEQVVFRGVGERTVGEWTFTLEDHAIDAEEVDSSGETSSANSMRSTPVNAMSYKATPFAHQGLKAATQAAKKHQRMKLVFVSMDKCLFCDKMQAETFTNSNVSRLLTDEYESVVIKRQDYPQLVSEHEIKIFPTTLVFSSAGNLLTKIDGFVEPADFLSRLKSHTPDTPE